MKISERAITNESTHIGTEIDRLTVALKLSNIDLFHLLHDWNMGWNIVLQINLKISERATIQTLCEKGVYLNFPVNINIVRRSAT